MNIRIARIVRLNGFILSVCVRESQFLACSRNEFSGQAERTKMLSQSLPIGNGPVRTAGQLTGRVR